MILGGGRMAFYLARELEESGFSVKIISNSYDKCVEIKSGLEKTQVICGDYTNRDVLENEGIEGTDAVVCMSAYDENNIVTSLFAREKKVEKTITVLHGDSYRGILESIQIDTVVSPYRLTAAELARYLRAVDVQENCAVKALYKIAGEKVEALLFNINSDERFVGKKLMELQLRKGVLLAAVIRGKTASIPSGSFELEHNDDLIVISSGKQILGLEDILQS